MSALPTAAAAAEAAGERGARAETTVVMKFGGSSVADPERIREVAARLVAARRSGSRVVGVVSAMGRTTDDLIRLAGEVSPHPDPRELDMLLSVGERIACALVAMAINDLGVEAVSLTGSQAGIITDAEHGRAAIVDVRAHRVTEALDADRIVLVAGFQGMSAKRDITTLGRGGADLTAVALAAALGARRCEIYTGAGGIWTADPAIAPGARVIPALGYEEMLELAAAGTGTVQLRSVELARSGGVALHVRPAFGDAPGTWVVEEESPLIENQTISAVTQTTDETVYRVHGPHPSELFPALAERQVVVDSILQTSGDTIVFSAPQSDRAATAALLDELGASWSHFDDFGKITLAGAGMKSSADVAARTFQILRNLRVEPHFISTSPVKVSFYVSALRLEETVRALHEAFELGATEAG